MHLPENIEFDREIEKIIQKKLDQFDPSLTQPFLDRVKEMVGAKCEAIVVYGSCLSDVTCSPTSTPDFYLLVKNYFQFHTSKFHALLNYVLPPNIYHFEINGRQSKFNVISLAALKKQTSIHASDTYQLGRFSKRIAMAWAKTPEIRAFIAKIQASAMSVVAQKTICRMSNPFNMESFIQEALRLSYYGDVRVEAHNKIQKLLEAEKEFYQAVYGKVLKKMEIANWITYEKDPSTFRKVDRGWLDFLDRTKESYFLWKSQIRAQLRWPKGIFTVHGWVDYLLTKIERTQGIRIQLTPHQKKLWFIYGWKYFFSLRRKNLLK